MTDSPELSGNNGDRLSISLTGDAADFVRDFLDRHPDQKSAANIVQNGLSLIRMIESLEPNQRLSVVNASDDSVRPLHIPWAPEANSVSVKSF